MKKLDDIIHDIDVKVDQKIQPFASFFKKYFVLFSSSLLVLLLVFFISKSYYDKAYFNALIIKNDLKQVNSILHKIDTDCSILSLASNRVQINFLTVKAFTGSVIGGINLAYPHKWTGPYAEINPTLQQKFYEFVKAKDGYYVIPGIGVKLPNNIIMGKDVMIDEKSTVEDMIKPGGKLSYKGNAFARKITFEIGDWDSAKKNRKLEASEKANDIIQELNDAIPYTQNTAPSLPVKA